MSTAEVTDYLNNMAALEGAYPNVDFVYEDCCEHHQPLNCNQKAYAAWWLWARLVGRDVERLEEYAPEIIYKIQI